MSYNEPAFPVNRVKHDCFGLSMRDYFAANIDIPWNAVIETLNLMRPTDKFTVGEVADYRAKMRYAEADAMLIAREKKGGDE